MDSGAQWELTLDRQGLGSLSVGTEEGRDRGAAVAVRRRECGESESSVLPALIGSGKKK